MSNNTKQNIEQALESLRWGPDSVITNYDGERVWLRELFREGKQIGITDCCPEAEPCDYHAGLASATVVRDTQ